MDNVVFFSVDDRYLPMALINAAVLVEEAERCFDVLIFLAGVPPADLQVPTGVRLVPNDLEDRVSPAVSTHARGTRIAYTRIFAPYKLAGTYRRALYLDADVAVFGAVSPLFGLDMSGAPLAAVEGMMNETARWSKIDIAAYKSGLGVQDGRTFNSGVLLMDLAAWTAVDHESALGRGEDLTFSPKQQVD